MFDAGGQMWQRSLGLAPRGEEAGEALIDPAMRLALQEAVAAGDYPDLKAALDDALALWRDLRAARAGGAVRECLEMCGRDPAFSAPFDAMKARLVALHAEALGSQGR